MARDIRHGNQEPRIRYEQEYAYSDGAIASKLADQFGLTPDPWQKSVLEAWLARNEDDSYRHLSCGLSVPRQNGKNALIEMRELYGLVACNEIILHTSHRVDTNKKAFLRLCSFFNPKKYPDMAKRVKRISRTNGMEAIELYTADGREDGGSIEFSARTRSGARGASYGLVVFDEAQELTAEQFEAIMFTLSASDEERQMVYTGTPPGLNAPGDIFAQRRTSAINETNHNMCWHEWSVEELGDVSDRTRWYATNPAMGYRLTEQWTEEEYNTNTAEGFARERLGWWQSNSGQSLFDMTAWNKLGIDKAEDTPQDGKMALGVKFSVDGSRVSVAVALKPKDGKPYVEGLFNRSMNQGISWIRDFIVERKDKLAIVSLDGRSSTDNLISMLLDSGYPPKGVTVAGTRGIISATTMFYNAYQEGKLSHYNQQGVNTAISQTMKRNIGNDGGWGFDGKQDADVTIVEACALAYWGAMTTKRDPKRKAKVF